MSTQDVHILLTYHEWNLKVAHSNGHGDDVPEKLQGISMSLQVASAMSNLTILTKSDNEQGDAASIEASIHVLLMR